MNNPLKIQNRYSIGLCVKEKRISPSLKNYSACLSASWDFIRIKRICIFYETLLQM